MKRMILAIVMILAVQAALIAQPRDRKDRMEHKRDRIMKELNLTERQKEDIERLKLEVQKQMADKKASLEKLRIEMKEHMLKKELNEKDILALHGKMESLRSEMRDMQIKRWLETYKMLDEKQKEIWRSKSPFLRRF